MKDEVKSRDIKYLWHFTKIENLESILRNGLIPRAALESHITNIRFNDQYRIDGHKDANCLSIGHPNYKMFYSLRQNDETQEWVVLAIKQKILWLKDCAFCHENAASINVTSIPVSQRKSVEAFRKMFEPVVGKPDRAAVKLPSNCPTNPQAEVLVFDTIEPEYIAGVVTPNKRIETELALKYKDFKFLYHRAHYSARLDYEHW